MSIIRHDLALTAAAEFSDCERYRYVLRRCFAGSVLDAPANPVVFCMLNPSTATAMENDPTVRRCIGFAKAWGHSDLLVVNLFAMRSTDPDELTRAVDPVGPENDAALASIPATVPVVLACGSHKMVTKRLARAAEILARPLLCLGVTAAGLPKHPLYLRVDSPLIPWNNGCDSGGNVGRYPEDSAKPRAKEGSRTPTGITPQEPESSATVTIQPKTSVSAEATRQRTAANSGAMTDCGGNSQKGM